ncbi:MAG: AgmX/PglI C-terminal domain-containing protein [Polyangia bacterium]
MRRHRLALIGGLALASSGALAEPPPPPNRPPDAGAAAKPPVPAAAPAPTTSADGPIQTDAVRRVMRMKLGAVKRCYDQGLARRPELAGNILLRFAIQTNGAVSDCQVIRSTLADEPVERCIAAVVRGLEFPKAPRPTVVTYPFVFTTTQVP